MDSALYLIASHAEDEPLLADLRALMETQHPQAMLVRQAGRNASAYGRLVLDIAKIAQPRGCAVLLDNLPDRVAELRADGVHMTTGMGALRHAVDALKPDFIVGAGDIGSRHEAMLRGELEIDYLLFGDRGDDDGAEMATWWAQTFEIPSVYRAKSGDDPAIATVGTEFVAFEHASWPALDASSNEGAA